MFSALFQSSQILDSQCLNAPKNFPTFARFQQSPAPPPSWCQLHVTQVRMISISSCWRHTPSSAPPQCHEGPPNSPHAPLSPGDGCFIVVRRPRLGPPLLGPGIACRFPRWVGKSAGWLTDWLAGWLTQPAPLRTGCSHGISLLSWKPLVCVLNGNKD